MYVLITSSVHFLSQVTLFLVKFSKSYIIGGMINRNCYYNSMINKKSANEGYLVALLVC